jgi:asparagine synthase (glutamine-hydrolysing)
MCGIAGFTHSRTGPDPDLIRNSTFSLVHRGPDQQGTWESDHVSLGAVRLKIIDLAGGDQPIQSDDGDTVAVFNGEIYNFRELRRELESRGRRFRTDCDTEVVLEAFREWDTACFARLRGMFAVALWQESRRRLVLARDRLGIKPLYLCRLGADLLFGSEVKALLAHPNVSRRLNPRALGDFLSLNYIPGAETMIESIGKLPPGCWLEWRPGRERVEPYWTLEFAPRAWVIEEAKAELDRLLAEAVREHLIADVPLGVWLSGGLDSSTIVHYASRASASPLQTFSVSFAGRKFDESRWFREVARAYGTDHHEFDLAPGPAIAEAVEEIWRHADEPSADAGALPVWYLSRMTSRRVVVALSGEGADELFGGYYTYLADRYAATMRSLPAPLRRMALAAARRLPVSDEKIGFEYKLKRFLEGSLLAPEAAHLYWNGAMSEAQKSAALVRAEGPGPGRLFDGAPRGLDPLNRALWVDQRNYLPDDILNKCDRMSMAHSLEVRPAFLDHRIVEFAATLPPDLKVRGSTLKYLLRELMRGRLPEPVIARRKEGFDIPAHQWFRGILRPLLEDTVTRAAVEGAGVFRWEGVERLMRDHFARRVNAGYALWGLLTLFGWMKRWSVQPPARAAAPAPAFVTSSS